LINQSINTENNFYSFLCIPLALTLLTLTSAAGQIQHSPYSLANPDSHQQPPASHHDHVQTWLAHVFLLHKMAFFATNQAAARLATQLLLPSTQILYL